MGPIVFSQLARRARPPLRRGVRRSIFAIGLCLISGMPGVVFGQLDPMPMTRSDAGSVEPLQASAFRARRFLGGRTVAGNRSAARAMDAARQQHAAMLAQQAASSQSSSLTAAWQPLGPNQIASIAYGNVTGRVTSIAIDPADATGNTVYVGTTGGGVWKSTNAAGPAGSCYVRAAHGYAACV